MKHTHTQPKKKEREIGKRKFSDKKSESHERDGEREKVVENVEQINVVRYTL